MSETDCTALPVHHFTGLTAVGLVAGRPVWPIRGGSVDTQQEAPVDDKPETGEAPPPAEAPEQQPETDLAKEVEKWKALSRKNQERATANSEAAKKLAEIEDANKTEQEKLIAEAVKATRGEVLSEVGQKLAAAKIEAALTGIVPDPSSVVEDLNLGKYLTEDGDVDVDAVKALREKFSSIAGTKKPAEVDLKQGAQGKRPDISSRIAQAQADGDVKTALNLQAEQLAGLLAKQ